MIIDNNVVINNSMINQYTRFYSGVEQPHYAEARWLTPGVYIAQKIADNAFVRFIGDKMQEDYLQTIVVIDDDPEELLDKTFSLEQEIYKRFKGLRFDLRVRVIPPKNDITAIKNSTIAQYDRDRF